MSSIRPWPPAVSALRGGVRRAADMSRDGVAGDGSAAQRLLGRFTGRRSVDTALLELFTCAGRNAHRACLLVHDLISDFPDHAALAGEVTDAEHLGDSLTHEIMTRLGGDARSRGRLDAADLHALATALDDIVDHAEDAADSLGRYGIEASMDQAGALASVLVDASAAVVSALSALGSRADLAGRLAHIHRLETEGDRVLRNAVAALFVAGIDPMVVIRWKDILASLEAAIDACETVANVLEGIDLKLGRR